MEPFDFHSRTRVIYGLGAFERLGQIARDLNFRRTLLVADCGIIVCGYVHEATALLNQSGVEVVPFHEFAENPDTAMVESGRAFAASHQVDSIVALGGGSSLDCAKGINFVLTNGGSMRDYWGYGKTTRPLLPMIGVPTTAGTGSDAQSYALISDAETHAKMACGDQQAAFKVAILDPRLSVTMPANLTATTGYDAISHAVESYVTKKRNPISQMFAREAWRLLEANFERVLNEPSNLEARGAMLLGSYLAGMAIENSMLGATHSCANPLTQRYGTAHGVAIAVMLPHVVRWNNAAVADLYGHLNQVANQSSNGAAPGVALARRLEGLRSAGDLPKSLSHLGIPRSDLPTLAEEAAKQWTGNFNPRDWSAEGAMEVYESAL
jgi:alcohol dehydrogenase